MEARVLSAEVGSPGKLGALVGFELINSVQEPLQFGDPALGAGTNDLEHSCHSRADGFSRLAKIARCKLLDLSQGQAQPTQTTDHADTPERLLVEQPVVSSAASRRVDESHVLVQSQHLHGYTGPV